jgi:uncharacterized protein
MKITLQDVLKKYQSHPEFLGIELLHANQRGTVDSTPLHIACEKGEIGDVEILIANGADINLPGDLGNTPLHSAALTGKAEVIKRLLELGADPFLRNEFSQTPLQVAQLGNHHAAVSVILQYEPR